MEPESAHIREGSLDIFDVITALWRGRWIVLAISLAFGLAGLFYAIFATKWYRAEVVLMQSGNDQFGSGMSQFAGLASLAGLNVNTATSSQESIAVLQSREFAREFIERHNLLPVLGAFIRKGKEEKGSDPSDIRDAVKLVDEDLRSVSEDKKRGVVVLSVTWIEAKAAAEWANAMAVQLNQRMQSRALVEAQRNINYLRSRLEASTSPSEQQSLSRLLESEMQKLLVARGNEDFAFRIVDRAVVPKERVRPKRVLICLLAVTAGFALGGFVVLLWYLWVRRNGGLSRGMAAAT